ncbi:hypothetical protein QAD02_009028 [Eretmocerus hayati]|uniref:Uncharacterized protein n=1 Tax=Eretmocerus hayati TaxID=131215 RepID=A0ACC2N8Z3_9HYME|nr:hypothetical protein QAD02_009028 [Eretmocerus hayati]
MNPNSEWAPLPQRNKVSTKRNREAQAKLLIQLKEMFGSTFEADIIASVAENCNWKLDPCIDALINMSQIAQNTKPKPPVYDPWEDNDFCNHEPQHDFSTDPDFLSGNDADLLKLDDDELAQQKEEMRKFEQSKRIETASLCGLKVQYRPKGMENNSDDDADVVIEEESCDYRVDTPEPESIVNVCQFLSSPTQHPPKNIVPKLECVSTPSPPRSPRRSSPLSTLKRIESDIEKGYKILVLMRGASGCGKSYLAKDIVKKTIKGELSNHIFSTDDYFSKINRGTYKFDGSKLADAHAYNKDSVANAMREGWSPIIVDNTNTQAWEMEYYAVKAVEHGYIVETLEPNTPWFSKPGQLELKNRHGVQRQTIQRMLDRYEPDISGDKLLRMFKLRYKAGQEPPQMRNQPPLQPELESKLRDLNISEDTGATLEGSATSSPKPQRRPRMPKISQPQEVPQQQQKSELVQQQEEEKPQLLDQFSSNSPPQRLIDNEALNTIAKEYASYETTNTVSTVSSIETSTSNSDHQQRVNESWTEGTSYKEDSFLDLRLGAIGSERRATENPTEECDSEEVSGIDGGVEISESEVKAEERVKGDGAFSKCWDFTVVLEDSHAHSKPDKATELSEVQTEAGSIDSENLITEERNLENEPIVKDGVTAKSNESALDICDVNMSQPAESIKTTSNSEREESPETESDLSQTPVRSKSSELEGFSTEIFSSEPSTRSSNSSLEKVDLAQCELGGITENLIESKSEDQTSGGLGSLFSFIKNSFLGNEKDSTAKLPKLENCNQPNLPLDPATSEKSEFVVTPEVPLSPVIISPREPSSDLERDLNSESVFRDTESVLVDASIENEEFFEASEAIAGQARDVEELLREASSDLQLVEQLDFTERRMDNAMTEKTFTEMKKNLQVLDAFEDDENKVSKEPIDKVFGSKNVFPEKIQNDISNVDNVNLISWRESPFPSIPLDTVVAEAELPITGKVATRDCETFTDPYDFNIAYMASLDDVADIGSSDDYKVLQPVNRNINEYNRQIQNDLEFTPTRKLMLHKGTMTPARTNLLNLVDDPQISSALNEDEDDESLEEQKRLVEEQSRRELIEKFEHMIPQSCVLHVYEQLCAKDVEWTSDYLYNLMDNDDASLHAALDQLEAEASSVQGGGGDNEVNKSTLAGQATPDTLASALASSSSSSPGPSEDHQQQQQQHCTTPTTPTRARSSKKDKSKQLSTASAEKLALKQQLENMFVLSEDSYPKHALRVKRWKNRDFSKDRTSAATAASAEASAEMIGDLMSFEEQQQQQQQFLQEAIPSSDVNPRYSMRMDDCWTSYNPDQLQPEEEISDFDEEEEETMDLTLGHEFIRVLENNFGSSDFETPTGLFPVIKIKRSMAQELYTLWIESMQRQLWSMQEELDASIARDAEYARSLEKEEEEAIIREPEVPNLREIMDMELALANACNDFKHKYRKETPKDLTFRVTKKSLHELFPDCSADTLFEIYESHERNFEETIRVIKDNCGGSPITMADVLKKRKNLIDELQKESSYQTSKHNQLRSDAGFNEACGGDMYEQFNQEPELNEEQAMRAARDSRMEARRQLELRNQNYLKANEARRRKALDVAEYYSEMAKLHMRNMETANHAAASALITAQTHTNNKIDLHYFLVSEALHALDMFLDRQIGSLPKNGKKHVYIITGRGSRSSNGRSKIKPAVAQKLNQRNIRFCEENPGMLKAYLRNK